MFNVYKSYLWDLFWLICLGSFIFLLNNPIVIQIFVITTICRYIWHFKMIYKVKKKYPDEKILFINSMSIISTSFFMFFLICEIYYIIIPNLLYENIFILYKIFLFIVLFLSIVLIPILFFGNLTMQIMTDKRLLFYSLLNLYKFSNGYFFNKEVLLKDIKNIELNNIYINVNQFKIFDNNDTFYCLRITDRQEKIFSKFINKLLENKLDEK